MLCQRAFTKNLIVYLTQIQPNFMKKNLCNSLWAVFIFVLSANFVKAQYPIPTSLIWGASPFQDSLWAIDSTNYQVVVRNAPSLAGFTITGITGMAMDPTSAETYVILKVSGVSGRVLAKINLKTAVCSQVGNLGDNFSSITFDHTGQMYGATGNGATVPETLYLIDKLTGTKTLKYAMGNGADGEVICYNRYDGHLYHWSGGSTIVFEKFPVTNVSYTPTNIPTSGSNTGETFGAMCLDTGKFMISNINSTFRRLSTSGFYSNNIASLPDDLRGIVLEPAFAISDDTICNKDVIKIGSTGLQLFDSVYYHWGDGNISKLNAKVNGASHTYPSAGNYTVSIQLRTAFNLIPLTDTLFSYNVVVQPTPIVALTGNTKLCPSDSIVLSGTSGGISQWYKNGVAIAGATNTTYTVNTSGIYNMVKINLNGCKDSAAIGKSVISVPNPIVALGNDTTVCAQIILNAQNIGGTYLWSNSTTAQTLTITSSGTYNVLVTDTNNCSNRDTIAITINPLPIVALSGNTKLCPAGTVVLSGTGGGTRQWFKNGVAIPSATNTNYTVNSPGVYNMIKFNLNGCKDSAAIGKNVVSVPKPIVALGNDTASCTPIVLNAQNNNATYLWNTGITVQTLLVTNSGAYNVLVTDSNNCSNSDTINVTIHPLPTVNLGADTTRCGGSVTLNAQNNGSNYLWSNAATTQTITVTSSGVYSVKVTNPTTTCEKSDTISVTINAIPIVTFNLPSSIDTVCANSSPVILSGGLPLGGVYAGSGVTTGQFNPTVAGLGNQILSYTFTDTQGCSSSSAATINVSSCLGLTNNLLNATRIFPNPSKGQLTIQSNQKITKVEVINMLGNIIADYNINELSVVLDLNGKAKGLCSVLIYTENGIASKLIVIE
jgi:hypothetical protein